MFNNEILILLQVLTCCISIKIFSFSKNLTWNYYYCNLSRMIIWNSEVKIMLINLLLLTIAIFVISKVYPPLKIDSFPTAFVVAIVYSLINFFLRWILVFLTFPFMILSLGLFTFVINAFLLWITNKLVDGFKIHGVVNTIIASVLISLCTICLHLLV